MELEISDCATISEAMDVICDTLFDISMQVITFEKGTNRNETAMQIEDYIHNHISDPTLNVEEIADSLSFSTKYIRELFKEYYQVSRSDYLLCARIEMAKELLENAVDAHATAVTVEIKDGGCSMIRVTDNGWGIPKEEIPLAFLRHATSKIKTVEDLFTISSLGFRGEALASIAAVAQVELITKTGDSLTGSRYQIEGGVEKGLEEIGAPDGTTIIARNLFYNTPARKKFLKTPMTEGAHVAALVEKIALSHPDISIRFIQNNQNKLYTSGNHNLKDLIYTVFGREIAGNLLPVEINEDCP